MTLDQFFAGHDESRLIFAELQRAIDALGPADAQITRSQIAFRRRKPFAWAWVPAKYLRGPSAPLVLTLGGRSRDPSPRWKEIVQISPHRFTHHLELFSTVDIDDQVRAWLQRAWEAAA